MSRSRSLIHYCTKPCIEKRRSSQIVEVVKDDQEWRPTRTRSIEYSADLLFGGSFVGNDIKIIGNLTETVDYSLFVVCVGPGKRNELPQNVAPEHSTPELFASCLCHPYQRDPMSADYSAIRNVLEQSNRRFESIYAHAQ